jgi:hypothetical protein
MPARLCRALPAKYRTGAAVSCVTDTDIDTAIGSHALVTRVACRWWPPTRATYDCIGCTGRRRTAIADVRRHRGAAPSPRCGRRRARRRVRQMGVQDVRGCAAQTEGGNTQVVVRSVKPGNLPSFRAVGSSWVLGCGVFNADATDPNPHVPDHLWNILRLCCIHIVEALRPLHHPIILLLPPLA